WLTDDHARRFDPAVAPLVRATLVRLGERGCRLVVTQHHILLDGWSIPIVVRELMTLYARGGDASTLPRVTPYREYLAWVARQDRGAARAAWESALAGVTSGTRVAARRSGAAVAVPAEWRQERPA